MFKKHDRQEVNRPDLSVWKTLFSAQFPVRRGLPSEAFLKSTRPPRSRGASVDTFGPTNLRVKDGGGERDRTDDLVNANHALSQLSYTPVLKWWAKKDLNFRPHAYQARALTN